MKAHRTDLVSFAFGLVFLALSAWWLLAQLLGLALPPVGWFLASALILIGVFGLVGALRSGRPGQPEPAAGAGATEAAAPVSGASVSGASAPDSVPPRRPLARPCRSGRLSGSPGTLPCRGRHPRRRPPR